MPRPGQNVTASIRLIERLRNGTGGMGQVWLAEHLALGSRVAVKFMAPELIENQSHISRFTKEAQIAARLQSPHVARVTDHGTTAEDEPFIVMELLKGENLRGRMVRLGPRPLDEVCLLLNHAAKALSEAHREGLVHRDIKPDNLFVLDNEGEPFLKVLDFGIAKRIDPGRVSTLSTSELWGAPLYMSPERYLKPSDVDHRTDLWALGIVVYELLTGEPPFTGETPYNLTRAICELPFKPPRRHRPDLPEMIDAWMEQALAKDKHERFSTAMEMEDALRSVVKNPLPIAPLIKFDTAPFVQAEPVPASQRKPRETDWPPRGASDRPPESFKEGVWSPILADRYARTVAFDEVGTAVFAASWNGHLARIDLEDGHHRWSKALISRGLCIATGPGAVVVGCHDARIRIFHPQFGTLEKVLDGHTGPIRGVALGRGGSLLASCSEDDYVSLWRMSTGERIASVPKSWARAVTINPRTAAVASGGDDASVRIWDDRTGRVFEVRSGAGLVRAVLFSPRGELLAAGFGDGNVRLWSATTWGIVKTLEGDKVPVLSLAFDNTEKYVIGGLSNGAIRVWNLETGAVHQHLAGGGSRIESLAMSPDGRHLASGATDGRVNVYRWPLDPKLKEVPGSRRGMGI